ncbi:PQQ-binding-like beta-propeller repeat protein [Kitasatospora sp. NPDC101183]|uniref:PQQ-binding-like beta-propeller repeat protein n=1 Tax=Kitasatospora sp. NPDC101183 TaxID=3364100 RepID=UPI0037F52068
MNTDSTRHQAPPHLNRRRLLLSGLGGLGALALTGGATWWARREDAHGPRLWNSPELGGRVALPTDGARRGLFASGYDGAVSSLDPGTGAVRWSRTVAVAPPKDQLDGWQLANSGGWHLAAGDGVVCVVTTAGVQVLDAASGNLRWDVPLSEWSEAPETQGPVVGDGSVLATHGNALHCYEASTGALRWTGEPGILTLDEGTVYTAGRDGGLLALDARSGARRWAQGAVGPVDSPAVVHQGLVHLLHNGPVPGSAAVTALDAATGRTVWQRGRLPVAGPLSASGGVLCLLSGTHLMAMDAPTGDTRWTITVPNGLGRGQSSMTTADGAVYVGTNDDRLFAYDLATGRPLWHDEPERLRVDSQYTRVFLAATDSAVYRGTRTGLRALGAPPSA